MEATASSRVVSDASRAVVSVAVQVTFSVEVSTQVVATALLVGDWERAISEYAVNF